MELLYYKDRNIRNVSTAVTESWSEGEKNFARLGDVIYYAQGGGQKGDKGVISFGDQKTTVINCVKDENGLPVVITDIALPEGESVECELDWSFRYTQMRLHTALHLLHCFIEDYYGNDVTYPLSSNIEKDFAYNKYPEGVVNEEVVAHVNACFEKYISEDLPVETYPDEEKPLFRYWRCMDKVIPCGGIHVASLSELGAIEIATHTKKGVTTVKVLLKEGN